MMRPSCLIKVPSSLKDGSFFRWWIRFLTPYHSLTKREMDVAAALFHLRYELSASVSDPILLNKLVLNKDSRALIERKLGLSHGHMKLLLTKLRRSGIVIDDRLNPSFIPDVTRNSNGVFTTLLVFDLRDNAKRPEKKD